MKHSKFILKAKKYLSKDLSDRYLSNRYVCCALQDATATVHQHELYVEITKLIAKRLKPYNTITEWLVRKHDVNLYQVSDAQIQDYRLRWMDSLAEEYERAGK